MNMAQLTFEMGKVEEDFPAIKPNKGLITKYQLQGVLALFTALKYRDLSTASHSFMMGVYAYRLASLFDPKHAVLYYYGGLVHDVGKIAMRDHILKGQHRLSIDERKEIKDHVAVGHTILEEMNMPDIIQMIALYHHELYDGSGYLYGLNQKQIPLAGRISAVADVYSAILTDRPYQASRSPKEALSIMMSDAHKFDPDILKSFILIINQE